MQRDRSMCQRSLLFLLYFYIKDKKNNTGAAPVFRWPSVSVCVCVCVCVSVCVCVGGLLSRTVYFQGMTGRKERLIVLSE